MSVAIIKKVKIFYEKSINKNIESILKTVVKNYELFEPLVTNKTALSLVPTSDRDVIYISDFDEVFADIVRDFVDVRQIERISTDPYVFESLYKEILFTSSSILSEMYNYQTNLSEEMLNFIFAYLYFKEKGTFEDFVEYLKEQKEQKEIKEWCLEKARYNIYNEVVEHTINSVKGSIGPYFEGIIATCEKMIQRSSADVLKVAKTENYKLPLSSPKKCEELFYEFLTFINAPEHWKELYKDLKEKNGIEFVKNQNLFDFSHCYKSGIWKIIIEQDGTISNFRDLVHEFAHYITGYKYDETRCTAENVFLTEFPSIFFEGLAIEFLREKGYRKEVIDKLRSGRVEDNIALSIENAEIFTGIHDIMVNGYISKAEMLKNNKDLIRASFAENPYISIDETDLDILATRETGKICDCLIHKYYEDGLAIFDGFSYLFSSYIAEELLKQVRNDSKIIPEMIDITENYYSLTTHEILSRFNIPGIAESNSKKEVNTTRSLKHKQ